MIRPALFTDIPRVEELLREMYAASKYAGRVAISDKAMRDLLMHCVQFQRKPGPAGTNFDVIEAFGRVCGFMIGQLDRVYHIGNKLMAQDMFLYVSPGGPASAAPRLIESYIAWASGNPKVLEILCSWNDTMPGAERLAPLLIRKGFTKTGEIFERRTDASPGTAEAAA